jgi:hypothetical protein
MARRNRQCGYCEWPLGWWRALLYGACGTCLFRVSHGGSPGRREHWDRPGSRPGERVAGRKARR